MTRWFLPLIVVAELIAAGYFAWQTRNQPTPPVAQLERLDPPTARDIEELRRNVGSDPRRWGELGEVYMAFGCFPEAEACFRHAHPLLPDSFDILYGWAYALQRLGRLEESIERFQQAAEAAPATMRLTCWHHIGRAWLRLEKVEQAEEAFRQSVEFPPSRFQLAKILVRAGRPEEAREHLDKLLKEAPDSLQPLRYRAQAADSLEKPELAADFRDRAERSPDKLPLTDHHMYLNPIRFRYGAGRKISAQVELRSQGLESQAARGLHQLYSDLEIQDRRRLTPTLAELELELGQPAKAEELLLEHFEHASVTPETLLLLGDAQRMLGRIEEAKQTWLRVLRLRPAADPHLRLARLAELAGDAEQARRHGARALAFAGIELFRQNRLEEARQSLEQAVRQDPEFDRSWFYLGETRRALRETEPARDAYRKCLDLTPTHSRAQSALARLQP